MAIRYFFKAISSHNFIIMKCQTDSIMEMAAQMGTLCEHFGGRFGIRNRCVS